MSQNPPAQHEIRSFMMRPRILRASSSIDSAVVRSHQRCRSSQCVEHATTSARGSNTHRIAGRVSTLSRAVARLRSAVALSRANRYAPRNAVRRRYPDVCRARVENGAAHHPRGTSFNRLGRHPERTKRASHSRWQPRIRLGPRLRNSTGPTGRRALPSSRPPSRGWC